MLDENLPTFYLKPLKETVNSVNQDAAILLSQYGNDAHPAYIIRHPDPSSLASKNRYAVALYDSHNSDILFGEVLLIPTFTQPTLSQEEINRNGGIPPPPQPVMPSEFTVQLYNPDQQIIVKHDKGSWNSGANWSFEMPQQTFRQPSTSALDRTQSDPTASEITPKIEFRWKKDSKLSKDLILNLCGKSRNPDGSKRKNKEPDIAMAFFRHLRDITVYEPNLSRVDMEDAKGFEIVMMLSAAVIRDVYFGPMKEVFNISDPSPTLAPRPNNQLPKPIILASQQLPPPPARLPIQSSSSALRPGQPPTQPSNKPNPQIASRPPPNDPRSQWEIDAETTRLRKAVEAEERARKKAEKEETKRIKRLYEEEQREAARKQAEVDKETERLRRKYGQEQAQIAARIQATPQLPPRNYNTSGRHSTDGRPFTVPPQWPGQQQWGPPAPGGYQPQPGPGQAMYLQPPQQGGSSWLQPGGYAPPQQGPPVLKPKRSSFWGLRGGGEEEGGRKLVSKKSAIF